MGLTISRYEWDAAPEAIKTIRKEVFIEEQHVPEDMEWDESDEIAQHFLVSKDGQAAAVSRFIVVDTVGKIGRIAVSKSYRRQGIAVELLREMINEGLSQGCTEFYLSAQTQAQNVYKRLGFFPTGDVYLDAGIDHIDMINKTPELIQHLPEEAFTADSVNFILGEDSDTHRFSSPTECKQLITAMTCQGYSQIKILSHHLESELFDNPTIRDAISQLARTNARSEIQLLVVDERPLISQTQQLIELMRRIPSRISLKVINSSYPYDGCAMVLVDRHGVIFQKENNIYEGFANFANAARVKQCSETFDTLWRYATNSLELRQLKL